MISAARAPRAHRREGRIVASACALLGLWLGWTSAVHAQAPRYRLEPAGALRAGIYDPHPRLCSGGELTQRDLRVLRLAFGVSRDAASRQKPPWFLELASKPGERLALRLKTGALWDLPPDWFTDPAQGAGIAGDPLARWRTRLPSLLGLEAAKSSAHALELQFDSASEDPFLWSRMHGSLALPRIETWRSSDLGEACPNWPAGVWLREANGDLRYVLSIHRPSKNEAFVIGGYRGDSALWGAFRQGRLDAVLVEGEDVASARPGDLGNPVWGAELGTQQIVLRPAAGLAAKLGTHRLAALSQAIAREELAGLSGSGRFAPAVGFLAPLLTRPLSGQNPPDKQDPPNNVLRGNPRDARLAWLAEPLEQAAPLEQALFKIATLPHPALEAIARAVAGQWQRTLNVKTAVTTVPVDIFEESFAQGEYDWFLTVADLDDGSLQDLWLDALREIDVDATGRDNKAEQLFAQFEFSLLMGLPYLPLVQNVHYVIGRDPAAVRALCPGCEVPARAPRRFGAADDDAVIPPEG